MAGHHWRPRSRRAGSKGLLSMCSGVGGNEGNGGGPLGAGPVAKKELKRPGELVSGCVQRRARLAGLLGNRFRVRMSAGWICMMQY